MRVAASGVRGGTSRFAWVRAAAAGWSALCVRQKKAPLKGLFQTLLLFFIVRVLEDQRLMDLPRRFLLTLIGTTLSLGSRLLGRSTVAMAARRMTASISISMMSRSS